MLVALALAASLATPHLFAETRCLTAPDGSLTEPGCGRALPAWRLSTPLRLAYHWRPAYLQVVPRSSPPLPDELVLTAREYLGVPYVWGGLGQGGFDCSGFVNKVYAENGYDLPRTSREQFKIGRAVEPGELASGDLLFFVQNPGEERISHVGMYVANDEFIHDSTGKSQVAYDRLTSRYYSARFFGARRVLALPPGRYSNDDGSARPPGGARPQSVDEPTVEQVLAGIDDAGTSGGAGSATGGSAGGSAGAGVATASGGHGVARRVITEHAEGERPLQMLGTFAKGATTHVGPSLLRPEATTVGLRVGVGGVRGAATAVAAPEVTYFGHDNALHVAVAAPLQLPLTADESVAALLGAAWDEPVEYLKAIQEIRFGQKESELYVDLSRTASGTLGHGQLMRYYTPNVASRSVPDYVIESDALSLSADAVFAAGGAETFVDDVVRPSVVGALAYVRPAALLGSDDRLWRSVSTGLTYAGDLRAPYTASAGGGFTRKSAHGLSLDTEIKPLKTERLDLKTYVAASTLLAPETSGFGGALGALLRANLPGRITHVVRLRLEAQLSSPTFMPSYFDTTYRLNRKQAPVDAALATPLTKLELLEELEGTPNRFGVYAEASYQMHRRVSVMAAYEDGAPLGDLAAAERYAGRHLQLVLQVKDLYLPRSSRTLSFYLAYQLRNFHKLLPLVFDRRPNEYLFASVTFAAWRHVGFSAALRKGYNPDAPARAAVDGVVSVVASYEL